MVHTGTDGGLAHEGPRSRRQTAARAAPFLCRVAQADGKEDKFAGRGGEAVDVARGDGGGVRQTRRRLRRRHRVRTGRVQPALVLAQVKAPAQVIDRSESRVGGEGRGADETCRRTPEQGTEKTHGAPPAGGNPPKW